MLIIANCNFRNTKVAWVKVITEVMNDDHWQQILLQCFIKKLTQTNNYLSQIEVLLPTKNRK